ncbi:hypothetical protein CVIRNUC_005666 [Coccomyxa viridis]|uniref:FAD-binding domain-containing protein n=1 Tax=Coccomyxa viridis TaxID=1274662 RepID=A0AAV1I6H6_9CHLO|nr:hypothetical protein CVIRNUC_005666 [Coccomyxa viridis]
MEDGLIIVVGAGIGGLATAVGLHKVGFPVKVLEKSSDLREEGASINIAVNGWRAMDALGVSDILRKQFCRIERYVAMRDSGAILKTLCIDDCANGPHENRGCIRNELVKALASALPKDTIKFGCSVETVDISDEGCKVTLASGETMACKVLVGADGSYSKVKAALGGPAAEYAGWASYRAMACFEDGIPNFKPDFNLMYGGQQGGIAGYYPLDTHRCYYFLGFQASQEEADELKKANQEGKKADLARRVKNFPKHLKEAVAGTPQDEIFINHIGDRVVEPGETWGRKLSTLIGDAAHPTTPALGQGGCMALEDGVELAAALRDAAQTAAVPWAQVPAADIERTLRDFERRRSTRCAPLVAEARENGRRITARHSWLGLFMRDFFIKRYTMEPASQFKHTLWYPASLEMPVEA